MKRILVVDDSPVILAAARHVLVEAGYEVETRNGVVKELTLLGVRQPQYA